MTVVVVGAGPAGMAAAVRAAEEGAHVLVFDDNRTAGGQIWRAPSKPSAWFGRLEQSNATIVTGARVVSADARRRSLRIEEADRSYDVQYERLILATGSRELFLPFPGWTLPHVMGVGGLQALVKQGLSVAGKRIVVAGTGPLLVAVAAHLRKQGAIVPVVAEQARWPRLLRFSAHLFRHPSKLLEAILLGIPLRRTKYRSGSWVESAEPGHVWLRQGSKRWSESCDLLAVAYGLVPNVELASLLGCDLAAGVVSVDSLQRTSVSDVYSAGETTGIGGVDASLIEGQIAGLAAAGRLSLANALIRQRGAGARFASALRHAFALRPELRELPKPDTIVCRCEDVTFEQLQKVASWRAAKLHERCGMGPCQGRVCGPAVQFLFHWTPSSVRPPIFPARVSTLIREEHSA